MINAKYAMMFSIVVINEFFIISCLQLYIKLINPFKYFTHNHKESVIWFITLRRYYHIPKHTDKHNPRNAQAFPCLLSSMLLVFESGSFSEYMTIAKTLYFSKSIESASLANSHQKQENFSGKTKDLEFILVCMPIFQRTKRQKCYLKP